jgi:dihydroorotate dehydrogenase (fumarate)
MSSLHTTYLGLSLDNPLIVGASPLTRNAKAVRACADAGAGAVVLKSLFEEQIRHDSSNLNDSLQSEESWHSEVFAYMEANIGMRYGTREYLQTIRECKEAVDIPVIASINCVSAKRWQDFASEVASAGADALELNVAILPTTLDTPSTAIEDQYVNIVASARKAVKIPIGVKIGPNCSSLPSLCLRLRKAGANGFILFNRFYRSTIDLDSMQLVGTNRYSTPPEADIPLQWICLLADRIGADLAAGTGIHTSKEVIRMLLGGANAVQVVSTLFKNGLGHLTTLQQELAEWMERKGFASIEEFRGRMSQAANPNSLLFGRSQYIKALAGLKPH